MQRPYYKQPRQYTRAHQDIRREEMKAAAFGAVVTLACITVFMLIAFN